MKRYYICLSFAAGVLEIAVATAQTARTPSVAERVVGASPYALKADAEADAFVTATAEKAYAANCAGCHGADMHGKAGVPDLTDFEFIWGITGEETSDVGPVAELEQTIRYGVRNQDCPAVHDQALYGDCPDTRYSEMPAFATLGTLTGEQVRDMTEYVLSLSRQQADAAAAARGKMEFSQCVECHGPEGMGYKPYGGPDLTDDVWIYGKDRGSITASISAGRMGRCPAWVNKLDAATIKSLAVYIWRKVQG
jgi:cytochrome c oxidase cbb3-type subunit 3